jgi:hypothetical protein
MTPEQCIGGPCAKCGLPQIARQAGCQRSRQECSYGKFDALLPQGNEFARALGSLAGMLARMEIAINKLDARVRELEGRPQ